MVIMHCAGTLATTLAITAVVLAWPVRGLNVSEAGRTSFFNSISAFEQLLEIARLDMKARIVDGLNSGCTPMSVCTTPDDVPDADYTVNFSDAIPARFDFVQTKPFLGPLASNESAAELCEIDGLASEWRLSRDRASPRGDLLYQYYAASTNDFGIYPPRMWNCTAPYVPTSRPYYVVGATGPKTIVILIDTSTSSSNSTLRVDMEKAAAVRLVQQLSYVDFIQVATFDQTVTAIFNDFVPVTLGTKQQLVDAIQSRVQPATLANRGANLGAALNTAATLLRDAGDAGYGSGCNAMVVLLAGGRDDFVTERPEIVLAEYPSLLVFAHHIDVGDDDAASASVRLRRVACLAGGLYTESNSLAAAEENVLTTLSFVASVISSPAPRWTEVYEDAFGQGLIVSGVQPVYNNWTLHGLAVVDVALRNVSNGFSLSVDEVNALMRFQSKCDRIDQNGVHRSVVDMLQGAQCADIFEVGDDQLAVQKNRSVLIFFSILIPALMLALPASLQIWSPSPTTKLFKAMIALFAALWVVSLGLFWGASFDNIVSTKTFDPVLYTVDQHSSVPFQCCDTVECTCVDVDAPTCSFMLANVSEGQCNNGFKCCRNDCRPCYCANTSSGVVHCAECCGCGQAVMNEQCRVVCGTCHAVAVDISYTYRGTPIATKFATRCPRDDDRCPNEFLRKYPMGVESRGFVNSNNPSELRTNVALNYGYLVPIIVMTSISLFPYFVAVYVAVRGDIDKPDHHKRKIVVIEPAAGAAGAGK